MALLERLLLMHSQEGEFLAWPQLRSTFCACLSIAFSPIQSSEHISGNGVGTIKPLVFRLFLFNLVKYS